LIRGQARWLVLSYWIIAIHSDDLIYLINILKRLSINDSLFTLVTAPEIYGFKRFSLKFISIINPKFAPLLFN